MTARTCPNCSGTGNIPTGQYLDTPCPRCEGSGALPDNTEGRDD